MDAQQPKIDLKALTWKFLVALAMLHYSVKRDGKWERLGSRGRGVGGQGRVKKDSKTAQEGRHLPYMQPAPVLHQHYILFTDQASLLHSEPEVTPEHAGYGSSHLPKEGYF